MERRQIAFVGLNFGRTIIERLRRGKGNQFFEVAAVCDSDRQKAERVAAELGVRAYFGLDQLLADPESPAVVGLFTGPAGRAELIRQLIRRGKDVMTTKPFETDPRTALQVLQEAGQMGRIVHLNSPTPVPTGDLRQMEEWAEQYRLGRPVACRCDTWCSYREKPDGSWYDDPELCAAAPILRIGIYLINDLVRIFGPAAQVNVLQSRIFTERPTADNAQLGILFRNGAIANVFASFCTQDGDYYKDSLVLNYERGTIYRSSGPGRKETGEGDRTRLALKTLDETGRHIVEETVADGYCGEYQWEIFYRALQGEVFPDQIRPEQVAEGIKILAAMAEAAKTGMTTAIAG